MSSFWPEEAELTAIPDNQPTREAEYMTELKRLLALVDRAMGEEGIPAATRDRVVARVLHGTPTPAPDEPRDWAEPDPRDLAVVDMLADAAPDMNKTHRLPQVDGVGGER